MRISFTLLLSLLFTAPVASAHAGETPEQVYAASIEAVQQRGVGAVADYMHPDELARFKAMLMPLLDEGVPPEQSGTILRMFGTNATRESVTALPPAEFMRVVMSAMLNSFSPRDMAVNGAIIGSVREGEIVHLVTRSTVETHGVKVTSMEVVSFKPSGDTWRMLLSGEWEGFAQAMQAWRKRDEIE